LYKLGGDILLLFLFFSVLIQIIRKEKQLQHKEDNKQFQQDNAPKQLPQLHVTESLSIKVIYLINVSHHKTLF
jgi:hypothetical protein